MKAISTLLLTTFVTLSLTVFAIPFDRNILSSDRKPISGSFASRKSLQRRLVDVSLEEEDNYKPAKISLNEKAASDSIVESTAGCTKCKSVLHFSTKASEKYAVGTDIPTLNLKTKNSWAGLMPVTASKSDNFFFWLWGNDGRKPSDEIIIWLNGGPGCSSMYGMIIENGPFLYPSTNGKPYVNTYSWTKEAIMLYVEMPVGVGFSTGKSNVNNEEQLAQQFITFLDNFFITFPELKGKKLFFAAESYAAIYASYIMNHIYDQGNKVNLQGGMFISGLISSRTEQEDLVSYDFALEWANVLKLTKDDLASIKEKSDKCGYTGYLEKNLVYPPIGKLPPFSLDGCETVNTLFNLSQSRESTFNPYRVTIPDPLNDDPLGNPFAEVRKNTFFDNVQLQDYIHVPHKQWNVCIQGIGLADDTSPTPDKVIKNHHALLASAIERSSAGLMLLSGREDMVIMTQGTSLVLQNLTWNDMQGFQEKPSRPLLDSNGKSVGVWAEERGLTFVVFDDSGHSIPSDAPDPAFTTIQVMLGRRSFPESIRL